MKKWPWFLIILGVVLLDQGTKHWAEQTLLPYEPKAIFPMLNFTLAYNTGAAFSLLSHLGGVQRWFLTGFSVLMSLLLLIWLIRLPAKHRLQLAGVSLILGGALGNLWDRATLGHVIDFINVYYKHHHWPVFNIADSAICLGAFLLLLDLCKHPNND